MGPKQAFLSAKKILSKSLVKYTASILSGSIIAQVISLAAYPLLTHLYTPDDFGLLNVYLSIGGVWTLLATGEYQSSIMLPRSNQRAVSCFQAGFMVILLVTGLCALTIPFSSQIADYFQAPSLSTWYLLLPIFVFFSALWELFTYWYSREKKFRKVGSYQIWLSSTNTIGKIGLSFVPSLSAGMILATSISPIIALFANMGKQAKSLFHTLTQFSWAKVLGVARHYKNFPLYALPRNVLNYLGGNLPFFLLTPYFGLTEMGWLGMGLTLSFRPMNMFISALYKVLFQRVSEMVWQHQKISNFLLKALSKVLLIVIPAFIVLYIVLPDLTEFLLGEGWRQTGVYIRYMLFWLLALTLSSTLSFIPDLFLRQKSILYFEIVSFIFRFLALGLAIYWHSFQFALIGYFGVSTLISIGVTLWIVRLIYLYEKKL